MTPIDETRLAQSALHYGIRLEFYLSPEDIRSHFPQAEGGLFRTLLRFDSDLELVPPFEGRTVRLQRKASSLLSKTELLVIDTERRGQMIVYAKLAARDYAALLLPLALTLAWAPPGSTRAVVTVAFLLVTTALSIAGLYAIRRSAAHELARRLRIISFHSTGRWPA